MKQLPGMIESLSRILDRIAALCIVLMMSVVVLNILMRALFAKPFIGTMDYVNILMALTIGLGLAYCGLKNGHIAVDFIVEKLSMKTQSIIDIIMNLIALFFWGVSVWYMAEYARNMHLTNLVAGTVQIPIYPVVYLIAFGLAVLCLVLVLKISDSVRKVI